MGQVEIIRTRCLKLDEEILKIEEKEERLHQKKKELLEKKKSYEAEVTRIKAKAEIERNKRIVEIIQDAFGEITEERMSVFQEAIKEVADLQVVQIPSETTDYDLKENQHEE